MIAGEKTLADITVSYEGLKKWGVRVIHDDVVGIDAEKRKIKLAETRRARLRPRRAFARRRLHVDADVPALKSEDAQSKILHAWKAGPQTVALRKQLEDMKDGGVYALTIPEGAVPLPAGPYERASVIAGCFKAKKPKSKVLVLDANEDIVSKKGLFMKAWKTTTRASRIPPEQRAARRRCRQPHGDPRVRQGQGRRAQRRAAAARRHAGRSSRAPSSPTTAGPRSTGRAWNR